MPLFRWENTKETDGELFFLSGSQVLANGDQGDQKCTEPDGQKRDFQKYGQGKAAERQNGPVEMGPYDDHGREENIEECKCKKRRQHGKERQHHTEGGSDRFASFVRF